MPFTLKSFMATFTSAMLEVRIGMTMEASKMEPGGQIRIVQATMAHTKSNRALRLITLVAKMLEKGKHSEQPVPVAGHLAHVAKRKVSAVLQRRHHAALRPAQCN